MSTQTKWTPGPWTSRPSYHEGEPQGYVIQSGRKVIADLTCSPEDLSVEEANARLISLAPEMAEALRESILKADELAAKLSAVKDMFPLDHPMQNAAAYEVELTKARAILAELEGGK